MKCSAFKPKLIASFVAGEIEEKTYVHLVRHLKICYVCRKRCEEYAYDTALLDDILNRKIISIHAGSHYEVHHNDRKSIKTM